MGLDSYKDLKVWQKSFQLVLEIYKVTRLFPREETYGLVSQMRRAAVSLPSNISEGYARRNRGEYIQFVSIAYASAAELQTQLLLVQALNYIPETIFEQINSLLEEVMRMLFGLKRSLNS